MDGTTPAGAWHDEASDPIQDITDYKKLLGEQNIIPNPSFDPQQLLAEMIASKQAEINDFLVDQASVTDGPGETYTASASIKVPGGDWQKISHQFTQIGTAANKITLSTQGLTSQMYKFEAVYGTPTIYQPGDFYHTHYATKWPSAAPVLHKLVHRKSGKRFLQHPGSCDVDSCDVSIALEQMGDDAIPDEAHHGDRIAAATGEDGVYLYIAEEAPPPPKTHGPIKKAKDALFKTKLKK